jgi:hypothetical protein
VWVGLGILGCVAAHLCTENKQRLSPHGDTNLFRKSCFINLNSFNGTDQCVYCVRLGYCTKPTRVLASGVYNSCCGCRRYRRRILTLYRPSYVIILFFYFVTLLSCQDGKIEWPKADCFYILSHILATEYTALSGELQMSPDK